MDDRRKRKRKGRKKEIVNKKIRKESIKNKNEVGNKSENKKNEEDRQEIKELSGGDMHIAASFERDVYF